MAANHWEKAPIELLWPRNVDGEGRDLTTDCTDDTDLNDGLSIRDIRVIGGYTFVPVLYGLELRGEVLCAGIAFGSV
jgi:hypothetical protein